MSTVASLVREICSGFLFFVSAKCTDAKEAVAKMKEICCRNLEDKAMQNVFL